MSKKQKVLLIGWDAADWKIINPLLEAGHLPTLAKFIDEGVMGNLATLQPVLSPMLWNSIGTGMRPYKHGIYGFTEVNPHTNTVGPSLSTSRRVKAIWNMLSQEGYKSHVINWFVSHPPEAINGICISELFSKMPTDFNSKWEMPADVIHPASKSEEYSGFRVHPRELSGVDLQMFAPLIDQADQENDKRIQMLAKLIAEAATIQAATTQVLEHEEWDFLATYFGCIDHFCHGFMYYHPPQMEWVADQDFKIYSEVINNAYRYHDAMLARLLQFTDDDTTVIICSDHGFHSDHLRPTGTPMIPAGPAIWHRDQGIFLMKGPNVRKDELVHGANLLDITPTILQLFGLPLGRDMDGRPLIECFESVDEIQTIDSWENRDGGQPDGMHTETAALSQAESDAILEQFIALGYIERPEGDQDKQVEITRRELKWNVARAYVDAGEIHNAMPLLEELVDECPERRDYTVMLANSLQHYGLNEQAEKLIEAAINPIADASISADGTNPVDGFGILHTRAELALGRGDIDEAMDLINRIDEETIHEASGRSIVAARSMTLGATLMRMEDWQGAIPNFQRALEIDGDLARAHLAITQCLLKLERYDDAIDSGLNTIELEHQMAAGHYFLGTAFAKSGHRERAIAAYLTTLRYMPHHAPCHKRLASVYSTLEGHETDALFHQKKAEQILQLQKEHQAEFEKQRAEVVRRNRDRVARLIPFYKDLTVKEEKEALEKRALLERRKSGEKSPEEIEAANRKPFVIVSGLPRSGTSLMMQMLEAGGMQIMTDEERPADIDNPEGYLEWEAIKKIGAQPELILEAEGKAIKVISMLLTSLPKKYKYKVVFMLRPIEEVVASQQKMIDRLGTTGAQLDTDELVKSLTRHRDELFKVIPELAMSVMPVRYHGLLENPEKVAARIARFVGEDLLPDAELMVKAVRTDLYRNRQANEAVAALPRK